MKKYFEVVLSVIIIFIVFSVIVKGCQGCSEKEYTERRIDNIARVFMHEPGRYTVYYYADGDQRQILQQTFGSRCGGEQIYTDVPENEKMWVKYNMVSSVVGGTYMTSLEIHLHQASEVEGGGWNHGKFGSGQTIPLE